MTPTLPLRLRLLGTGGEGQGTGLYWAPTACQTLPYGFSGIRQPSGRVRRENRPRGEQATLGHLLPWQPPSFLSCRDRKKKRFVGQSGQEDKKKIKTESGRYISSSYKRDLYPEGWGWGLLPGSPMLGGQTPAWFPGVGAGPSPARGSPGLQDPAAASLTQRPSYQKWKQKQKIDDRDSEEEGSSHRRGPQGRGGKRGRGQGKAFPTMRVGKWCVWSPGTRSSALPARACAWCPQRGRPQGVWSSRLLTCSGERGLEPVSPAPQLAVREASHCCVGTGSAGHWPHRTSG